MQLENWMDGWIDTNSAWLDIGVQIRALFRSNI